MYCMYWFYKCRKCRLMAWCLFDLIFIVLIDVPLTRPGGTGLWQTECWVVVGRTHNTQHNMRRIRKWRSWIGFDGCHDASDGAHRAPLWPAAYVLLNRCCKNRICLAIYQRRYWLALIDCVTMEPLPSIVLPLDGWGIREWLAGFLSTLFSSGWDDRCLRSARA